MHRLNIKKRARTVFFAVAACAAALAISLPVMAADDDEEEEEVDPSGEEEPIDPSTAGYSEFSTTYTVPNAAQADLGDAPASTTIMTNIEGVVRSIVRNLEADRVSTSNPRFVNEVREVEAADYLWVPNVDGEGHGILYKRVGQNGRIFYVSVTNVNLKANGIIPDLN